MVAHVVAQLHGLLGLCAQGVVAGAGELLLGEQDGGLRPAAHQAFDSLDGQSDQGCNKTQRHQDEQQGKRGGLRAVGPL